MVYTPPQQAEYGAMAETIICRKCMAPNVSSDENCSECGAALSEVNYLNPIGSLFEQGASYTTAVYRPTKLLQVVTVWVLSVPALIGALFGILAAADMYGFQGFIFFWIFIGIATLAIVAMYRVTKNYVARHPGSADTGV
jgi:hypothetical protein